MHRVLCSTDLNASNYILSSLPTDSYNIIFSSLASSVDLYI